MDGRNLRAVEWKMKKKKNASAKGLEPLTLRLKAWCSTDWAKRTTRINWWKWRYTGTSRMNSTGYSLLAFRVLQRNRRPSRRERGVIANFHITGKFGAKIALEFRNGRNGRWFRQWSCDNQSRKRIQFRVAHWTVGTSCSETLRDWTEIDIGSNDNNIGGDNICPTFSLEGWWKSTTRD